MSYACKILADSVSPAGVRLTTFEVTFPRFILAEVNTHRMLSRNSASSRAIPPERLIERVLADPFIPETFNKRVKGMGVGEELNAMDQQRAREAWMFASGRAVAAAEALMELDCDKSRINRLLEPFMWHTAIISATEWENFFALRCHPDAQLEFQKIAGMMRYEMEAVTEIDEIDYGEWHLPLVSFPERNEHGDLGPLAPDEWWAEVSAGRCARVSFDTHDQYESSEDSHKRAVRLKTSGHLSPFEHCARPLERDGSLVFVGNFRGWVQLRKQIPHEHNFALVAEAVG